MISGCEIIKEFLCKRLEQNPVSGINVPSKFWIGVGFGFEMVWLNNLRKGVIYHKMTYVDKKRALIDPNNLFD